MRNTKLFQQEGKAFNDAFDKMMRNYHPAGGIIFAKKNKKDQYHSEDGPAVIAENGVIFMLGGEDWSNEKYENFIRSKAETLMPDINIKDAPFTQLESIVYSIENWGRKLSKRSLPLPDIDPDYIQVTRPGTLSVQTII